MKHSKFFPRLLLFSALTLSFCAAYFSVYGISSLFSGAMISVSIMAGCLEVAKLVSSSFLFRYWNKTKAFLKAYMLIGVVVLLIITSAGIFGYLSAAYQKSSTESKILTENVELINGQKKILIDRIAQSNKRIDFITKLRDTQETRLSEMLKNEEIAKNIIQLQEVQGQTADLIKKSDADFEVENKKIQEYTTSISKLDGEVSQLKIKGLEKRDITTFQFVADALGMNINSVVKWFILSLIFVFDPMAIAMLLAYNTIVYEHLTYGRDEDLIEKDEKVVKTAEASPIKEANQDNIPLKEAVAVEEKVKKSSGGAFSKILRKPFLKMYK